MQSNEHTPSIKPGKFSHRSTSTCPDRNNLKDKGVFLLIVPGKYSPSHQEKDNSRSRRQREKRRWDMKPQGPPSGTYFLQEGFTSDSPTSRELGVQTRVSMGDI